MRSHRRFQSINAPALLALLFSLLAAACSPSPPPVTVTSSAAPTSPFNTSAAPEMRRTLPPEWTAAPSSTPAPSNTPTATIPPTPTPTLSIDDLCAALHIDLPYEAGHVFRLDDTMVLFFGTTVRTWTSQIYAVTPTPAGTSAALTPEATRPPAVLTVTVTARFEATHRESDETLGIQAAGGEITGLQIPVSQLGQPGIYDWTVSVYVNSLGSRCAQSGTFEVAEGTDEPS